MENNELVIRENGEDVVYRVILNIENENNKNYVVYTKDELDKNGDIISYVANYEEVNGEIKLTSIKDDKEWEFIRDIVNSIEI